jgi:hypothetical protein
MRQWPAGVVVGAIVGGLVAGILVAVLVPSIIRAAPDEQTVPRIVRAEQFQLLDPRGTQRAFMGFSDDGSTVVDLMDQDGVQRVRLLVGRRMGTMLIGVPGAGRPASLTVDDELASIAVRYEQARAFAAAGGPQGDAVSGSFLQLTDSNGHVTALIP